jgi:CyaY protein
MDEKEFGRRAADALRKLDDALRDVDGVESDLAGDILTLEFEDGAKFVVNSHSAAQQIWMSANMQAWHFGWDPAGQKWRDSRSGTELFAELGRLVSEKLAQPVVLRS